MAEKKTEDFLTCAVCYDVMKDPRILSCGHTFCRSCLSQFTLSSAEAAAAGSVPCPLCRQMTKVPDSSVSREKWAGQMERNVLLSELKDLDAIVRRDADTENDDEETNECAERKRRYQDTFYCLDCNSIVFNERCDSKHLNCKIVTAREASPYIVENLTVTRETLKAVSKATIAQTEQLKSRRQKLERSKQDVNEEIRAMCERAMAAVRRREAVLLAEVEKKANEELKKIHIGIRQTERSSEVQQPQADLVDGILSDGTDLGKLEMQDRSSKLFFEDEGPGTHNQFQTFSVKHDINSLDVILHNVLQGVQVEFALSDYQQSLCADLRDNTIDVKIEDDEEAPFLVDVVVISHKGAYALIVTDNSNCCARSFYKDGNFDIIESKINFDSPPWGIDKLVSNQVLIAVPGSREITRLRVSPKLETLEKISTDKSYRSIAVLNHLTIVAGFYSLEYTCVDILDLSGEIQRSFSSEFPVMNPSYLTSFRQDSFLVSDSALGTVTCVNLEGDVQFTHKRGLKGPSGISVDMKGNILIVDREAGNLVSYVNDDTKSLRRPRIQTLTGETEQTPWGVCVDKNDHVYVTQGGSIRLITDFELYNQPQE